MPVFFNSSGLFAIIASMIPTGQCSWGWIGSFKTMEGHSAFKNDKEFKRSHKVLNGKAIELHELGKGIKPQ